MVLLEAIPEFLLVPFLTEWRSEDVFRSFKPGRIEVLEGEVQVLRAGLGVDGKSAIAGLANFLECLIAAQVDDVDGRACHFGERNGATHSFSLCRGRTSKGMILRRAFSFRQGLLH